MRRDRAEVEHHLVTSASFALHYGCYVPYGLIGSTSHRPCIPIPPAATANLKVSMLLIRYSHIAYYSGLSSCSVALLFRRTKPVGPPRPRT